MLGAAAGAAAARDGVISVIARPTLHFQRHHVPSAVYAVPQPELLAFAFWSAFDRVLALSDLPALIRRRTPHLYAS